MAPYDLFSKGSASWDRRIVHWRSLLFAKRTAPVTARYPLPDRVVTVSRVFLSDLPVQGIANRLDTEGIPYERRQKQPS